MLGFSIGIGLTGFIGQGGGTSPAWLITPGDASAVVSRAPPAPSVPVIVAVGDGSATVGG